MEEFWEEMRRREREEEEGEARPQKSKMWRVRGKQRAGGTGAATLPSIPSPSHPPNSPTSTPHPPPCTATMMQATVSAVCEKGRRCAHALCAEEVA